MDQLQQNYPSHHFHQPPIGSVPVVPHLMPNNGDLSKDSIQTPAVAIAVSPQPTSPTGPPPPFPPTNNTVTTQIPSNRTTNAHNDLNDAQNISKILQSSIHNGGNSTINSNHTSNEKRLFIDENVQSHTNHKEERSSSNDKQPHHRGKRKQKQLPPASKKSAAVITPTTAAVDKQHSHTNGLISTTDKKNANKHSITANGEESMDDEVMDKLKEENMETRSLVFKEIRKLGRDYRGLYEQLAKIKGTFEMRFCFIQMCIDEASRFRRKHMADCIQEWWASRCDGAETQASNNKKT
jgi:INTS6/SAGE1/DDX26B/CT45 C-terminus